MRPSISPWTPLPGIERKDCTARSPIFRSSAARRIASANGCSLPRSTLAARRRRSRSVTSDVGTRDTTRGLPSVSVPVLSRINVSTFSITSSTSAFLINTPAAAPRPIPTMMDIGVARPRAHGHAMIKTATALSRACEKRG